MGAMTGESALLRVRVQPRAKRDEVVGERAGAIVIRLNAPPVDGKANAALSRSSRRPRTSPARMWRSCAGPAVREKAVRVSGVAEQDLRRALGL